jgi:hypothetical protein
LANRQGNLSHKKFVASLPNRRLALHLVPAIENSGYAHSAIPANFTVLAAMNPKHHHSLYRIRQEAPGAIDSNSGKLSAFLGWLQFIALVD